MSKNLFIVFEGIDGSGKTMQTEKLYFNINRQLNQEVHYTKEPTIGPIGVFIKEHFLSGKTEISEEALMYLFTADRIEHLYTGNNSLTKMLEKSHVICDRYMLSSLAYNSFAYQNEAVKQMAFGQTHRIPILHSLWTSRLRLLLNESNGAKAQKKFSIMWINYMKYMIVIKTLFMNIPITTSK